MRQDVARCDASNERARARDAEPLSRVLDVDSARQFVVSVNKRVDQDFANSVGGVVRKLKLGTARQILRADLEPSVDSSEKRFESSE